MASKMPAARDVAERKISISEAEHNQYTKPLKCEFCEAKVSFVGSYTRNVGDDIVVVAPFFRLTPKQAHSAECKYNVAGQVSVIARESEGDILVALENNKFELRLLAVKKALQELRELSGLEKTVDKDVPDSTTDKEYISASSRLGGYINTAKRVLKVRAICENDSEIASVLSLVFDGVRVSWNDFYFDDENYFRCYRQIRDSIVGMPIALSGVIKDIKNVPVNGKKFAVLELMKPMRETNEPGTLEVVGVSVWSQDLNAFSAYKINQEIVAFGIWQAKPRKENPNSKKGSSIKKYINFELRLWPVTQSQLSRA